MNKIKDYITQFKVAIKKMIRDFVEQYAMARGLEIFPVFITCVCSTSFYI